MHIHKPLDEDQSSGTSPRRSKPTPHKCPVCQKSFRKPSQVQRHMRIHTGESRFKSANTIVEVFFDILLILKLTDFLLSLTELETFC